MNHVKKHIPNTITCLNLVAGCIAVVMALEGRLLDAAAWVMAAAALDFLDGLAARLLKAYSPIGKELDSLADIVSFGVAPGMALFWLLREASAALPLGEMNGYVPFLAFVIPAFSGLRLAKFNIDERQTSSFIGLPVPAHALFWSSLGYALQPAVQGNERAFTAAAIPLAVVTSLLLVSEIPMFSLKIKSFAWKGNELRYLLAGCAVVFILFAGFLGVAGTVLLYVLLSLFNRKR
ncbi:MAG: CDP-diacylglycerol--serine O-phosphatidyltransferase [Tannerellaceae bacterium]|jgi:CDP-diacylglycerol--serine O-phosphatidyltransferase|nr:CDP-diacylglycerol--serine O-phosphatidyltransferase [Tannerellaceae bacterium]